MSKFNFKVSADLDTSKIKQQLKSLENQKIKLNVSLNTADIQKKLQALKSQELKIKTNVDVGNATQQVKKVNNTLAKATKDKITFKIDADVAQANASINKFASQSTKSIEKARKLINQINKDLVNVKYAPNDHVLVDNYEKLTTHLTQFKNQMKVVNAESKTLDTSITSAAKSFNVMDASIARNKTLTWLKNNSKAAKDYGEVLQDLAEKQRNASSSEELQNYTKQVRQIQTEASKLGKTGKSFQDEFSRAFNQIFQFSQIYGGIDRVIDSVSNAVIELKEMDSILTEISKVSDMSDSQLKQLGQDAFDYASKYGQKVTDYLNGVTEMNRSGFYGQQGIDLANTSVLAQAAGDMTADVANAYLLATNAAYEYAGSAEKLNAVLDGQNMINITVMLYRNI